MKRILALVVLIAMSQTLVFAQKQKSVKESDVPVKYVKDFQNQVKDASDVVWAMSLDSTYYMVCYTSAEGDKMAKKFAPKSVETHYYVESQYYPHAIKDTVAHQYPKHKITSIYIRELKNKMTYQCRIATTKGFLFWKKEADAKVLSFETDGKMIEVIDEQ